MQIVVALAVVASVVVLWVRVCHHIVRWQSEGAQRVAGPGAARRSALRLAGSRRCLPLLPEGHRPPPGLGPLSPSERFLTSEAARGLRELQLFLLDQAGSSR